MVAGVTKAVGMTDVIDMLEVGKALKRELTALGEIMRVVVLALILTMPTLIWLWR